MKPVTLPAGVFGPADVCEELAPILAPLLDRLRRDRVPLSADAVSFLERIVRAGQAWSVRTLPAVPIERGGGSDAETCGSDRDIAGSDSPDSLSVKAAADILGIGERAVVKRIAVRTIRAQMIKGTWKIDRSSLGEESL